MPLEVLILTNVPVPIPVDQLTAWSNLCATGPFDVLVARGVVPLDYAGIAAALPQQFADAVRVKDWFQYRPTLAPDSRASANQRPFWDMLT